MQVQKFLEGKGLTNKEVGVATQIVKGFSNKQAAVELKTSEKTVKYHLSNIYKKLNLKSRAQLIVLCLPHIMGSELATNEPSKNN